MRTFKITCRVCYVNPVVCWLYFTLFMVFRKLLALFIAPGNLQYKQRSPSVNFILKKANKQQTLFNVLYVFWERWAKNDFSKHIMTSLIRHVCAEPYNKYPYMCYLKRNITLSIKRKGMRVQYFNWAKFGPNGVVLLFVMLNLGNHCV